MFAVNSEDANPDPVVEETEAKPDGETSETETKAKESDSSTDAETGDKKSKGVQKRLDELTRNWREAERREQALLELLNKQTEPEKVKETQKTLSDFEFDNEKYIEYRLEIAEDKAEKSAARKIAELQSDRIGQLRKSSFQEREREFAKEHEDYFDKTRSAALTITEAMAEAIDDPEVAYFLSNNPERADVIARLDPIGAAKEIAKIEGRLELEREKAAKTVVSKAPPPAPKLEGSDPGTAEKDPGKMTDTQFRKWRLKQIANR